MTLHPLAVVEGVMSEFREHLITEFRARDPALRQAVEDTMDEPGFLAQEPFLPGVPALPDRTVLARARPRRPARRGDGGPHEVEVRLPAPE